MKTKTLLFVFSMICWNMFPQPPGKTILAENTIGTTNYDLQTNESCQNRIYRFPDGTIGATWMFSQTTSFDDRGTGYNYYNGASWGPYPTIRIENAKSGWPSYAPYNSNGEVVVSHKAILAPLNIAKRNTKGSGNWILGTIPVPANVTGFLWARMVTNGPNHTYIHVIANTAPLSNGGTLYQGLDGAILYNRSLDGGSSWLGWQLLPGMTSSLYRGFGADIYAWAEPKGDTLCFVVGDGWNDLFIMKSNNNGASWSKTMVWQCLYNKWTGGYATPIFYCPDGSNTVALDNVGKAHLVFGRQRARGDATGAKFWYPFTDGLIYWNEDQPQLVQSLDSATLVGGGHFIGWIQDPNVWTGGTTNLPYYYLSLSSMPSMTIDQNNHIFVIWSGVTNYRDQNNFMLRHIYARASVCNGEVWCPDIIELTSGPAYNTRECVYPSMSPTSTNDIYFVYQNDNLGGCYVKGSAGAQGQTVINSNDIRFQSVHKSSLYCGDAPQPDFISSHLNPVLYQTVTLTDLSANCPTSWQWAFSPTTVVYVDGTSSASQNPHVQFTVPGVYSVTLTSSNIFGTGTLTKTDYITVSPPPPPEADFLADTTSIYTRDSVQFTDLSTGNPASWEWTFEGGTPSAWTGQSPPSIQYLSAGTFDVTLMVSNEWGTTTDVKTDYITVMDPPPPVAAFVGVPDSIYALDSVQFTDLSTNNPTGWTWTFEGGIPETYDGQAPPPITYLVPGVYDVSLTASNESGTNTLTIPDYITVLNPFMPVAEFSGDKQSIIQGDSVLFTDESTGYPTTYAWTFDGGTPASSSEKSPPRIMYNTPGHYNVTLLVTNSNGESTMSKYNYISVSGTGIEEELAGQLMVFPNPVDDIVNLKSTWIICELSVLDIYGNCVMRGPVNKKAVSVDISSLTSGIYILSVKTDTRQIKRKIVVN
jgi:PKD repeat protein